MRAPAIILIRPQMVENIGMAARAMLNCSVSELRIVAPRDPWPLPDVLAQRLSAASSGADAILKNAKHFETTEEAVADLQAVYATTARPRDVVKEVVTPRRGVQEARAKMQAGQTIGFMFGPERTGLTNDDVLAADKIITIPTNPDFSSFNLAQTVLLIAYEWFQSGDATPESTIDYGKSEPATKAEQHNLFARIEDELEACGFFVNPDMKPAMQQNLRAALARAQFTEQEVRTLHGVLTALADGPKRKAKAS